MLLKLYKYHGAGNDFLLADNREGRLSLSTEQIRHLCDRHTGFGADGLMLLESSGTQAFRMLFYNPDGSHGMMCGNGGRCIVSFAVDLGVVPAEGMITFEAPDGPHKAEILPVAESVGAPASTQRIIRLKMKDVAGLRVWPDEQSCFLDTGRAIWSGLCRIWPATRFSLRAAFCVTIRVSPRREPMWTLSNC